MPAPPVARYSPAAGITINRTERSTSITGVMEMYGPGASSANATIAQTSINSTWTHRFTDYEINCHIRIQYRAPGTQSSNVTQIEAKAIAGPSNVRTSRGNKYMTLNTNRHDVFRWTAAHEFGHVLGLSDRYSESIMSSIRGQFGGARSTPANPGYETNIMAVTGGTLEEKNIQDLTRETAPGWLSTDDHVRDWVTAASVADIRRVSTTNKLRAIKIMMGGWISDDDMNAIIKIVRTVNTSAEAASFRAGIRVSSFSSLRQRFTVMAAMTHMPS